MNGGIQMKWNTRVTDLLNIKYPIIQGGLAHTWHMQNWLQRCRMQGAWPNHCHVIDDPEQVK